MSTEELKEIFDYLAKDSIRRYTNLKFINYFVDYPIISRNHFSDDIYIYLWNYSSDERIINYILSPLIDRIEIEGIMAALEVKYSSLW